MRAATRMAYAIMLADSVTASARYATTYSVERARQLLDLG
jgi:membrane-associated HD superfamily phosphohydrolase